MIQDVQTERAVLGAVLTLSAAGEAKAAVDGTGPLPAEAFTEARRHVWEAMLALVDEGQAVDPLTLAERLQARGRLAECGGPAGLMALDAAVPFIHNLPSYVAILRGCMERRRLEALGEMILRQARDLAVPPSKTTATVAQALTDAGATTGEEEPDVDLSELAVQWAGYVERMANGKPRGLDDGVLLATGIEQLDAVAEGIPSNLCVWLGLQSMGKTALAAEVIMNWIKAGIPGGIIGLEDGTKWLTRRHLSRYLGMPVKKVGRSLLHEHQLSRLDDWLRWAKEQYRKHLRIHRAGGLAAPDLLAVVRRWINAGVRWIWIDHGLRVDYAAGSDPRRYDMAIGRTLDVLATLGERHGVAVCVNWHLNRLSTPDVMPTAQQAKEGGYLEAAARFMVAAWEQRDKRPGYMLVTGLKVTEGARDWTVALERDPEHALVKSSGGYLVDFEREAYEEKQLAEDARAARKGRKLFGLGGGQ